MAGLLERIAAARSPETRDSDTPVGISIYDWAKMFRPGAQVNYNGQWLQAFQVNATGGLGAGYYESNPIVFSCELNRLMLFSEARFQFQQLRDGRAGDLFGTPALSVLETPWVGASTSDLLIQAELDAATGGNSYWVRDGVYLHRLDPGKVKILTEAVMENSYAGQPIGERLLAYAYTERQGDPAVIYLPGEICHYKPIPDRCNRFVGMSWLSPCLPDVDADQQMTTHKRSALLNGAIMPIAVSLSDTVTDEQFGEFVEGYKKSHSGPGNSGKTLFVRGGVDVKTVGQSFEDLSLKATQGAGETRVAACAGTPPVIVGLSEGLQGSSLNSGNYGQARRRMADLTIRPLWRAFASSLQSVVQVPAGSRLWYDDRDIAFLREDNADVAAIQSQEAQTIRTLIDAGFTPESATAAVTANDWSVLEHTHLYSVQLQPPMTTQPVSDPGPVAVPATSGNGATS